MNKELQDLIFMYGSVVIKESELTDELHAALSDFMLDCIASDAYTRKVKGGFVEVYAINLPSCVTEYEKLMSELKAYVKLNNKFPIDETIKRAIKSDLYKKFNDVFDALDEIAPLRFYKKCFKRYEKLSRKL